MAETSVEKDLLDELHRLEEDQQRRVLEFARTLANSKIVGAPGKSLLRFAGTINQDDLNEIARAIAEDCESVDSREW